MGKADVPAPLINWPELLRLSRFNIPESKPGKGNMWEDAADMYNKMAAMEYEYTFNQLDAFDISPEDTVLDVGCGPGRISVLIAQRAKSVTSIDKAEKMLYYCQKNARKAGVSNLTARLLDWNNAVLGENLEKHDIVIASRSEGMRDIEKLTSFARKYAVIIAWANAPCIPDILRDLFYGTSAWENKPLPVQRDRRLGYNVFYNMVYDLGYDPNIKIVTDGFTKDYADYEEAYADLRTLGKLADDEMDTFRHNCNKWLSKNDKGSITFRRETKSFVLWWTPEKRL